MVLIAFELNAKSYYRLYLSDKQDSEYCNFSERAKLRRTAQRISLDETDRVVSPSYLLQLSQSGLNIKTTSRWMNTAVVCSLNEDEISDDFWKQFAFVDSVVCVCNENSSTRAMKKSKTLDSVSGDGDENYLTPHYEIGANALYDRGYRGQGKLIAILDGGFLNANRIKSINKHVIGAYDMYNPSSSEELFKNEKHGTNCLSIMSSDGSLPILGSAPEAEYFLIRTEYADTETWLEEDMWIAGAELADSIGADLISSSLGYFEFDDEAMNHSRVELAAGTVYISRGADVATKKGIIVCVAAGNEAQSSWGTIDFPADVKDVLTIGAVTSTLEVSSFSSPGFLVPYVKPDVSCRGTDAYILSSITGTVQRGNGTSYATPLICGACASLWSAAPDLTALEIVDLVKKTAKNYNTPDELTGYGIADFAQALAVIDDLNSIEIIEREVKYSPEVFDISGMKVGNERPHSILIRNKKKGVLVTP